MDARSGAGEVVKLLGEIVTACLPRALVGGAIGFVVSVVVVVLLLRFGVLRRHHRVWNVLAKITCAYVPVVLTLSGAAFGVLGGAHQFADEAVHSELTPLAKEHFPTIQQWLIENNPGSVHDVLAKLYVRPASDGWVDRTTARAANYVTLNLGKWLVTAAAGAVLAYAAGRAGDSIGLSDDTVAMAVKVIREMDLSRVDDTFFEVLERALHDALGKIFEALFFKLALVVLAALSIPSLERGVYWLASERPRRLARAAQPSG